MSIADFDVWRLLDANANRAREALRVVEDHCRFALDDASLAGQLKAMRHDLIEAMSGLDPAALLLARDTPHDVGTRLESPGEVTRTDAAHVLAANFKRLQESLRTLEEYGKLASPDIGRRMQHLRYRAYTLERGILGHYYVQGRLEGRLLYVLVAESGCRGSLERTVREALAGGADLIQLREKSLADRLLLERAQAVAQWTHAAGALFIVNDRPDIARLAGADGVHVGQEELPVREARRILGPTRLVGVSTHSIDQAEAAVADGASYLSVGPVFASATKAFDRLAGLDYVRQAAARLRLPWFAIGGIGLDNIDQVIAAGARRVAVSAAVIAASDPRQAARALRGLLEAARPQEGTPHDAHS